MTVTVTVIVTVTVTMARKGEGGHLAEACELGGVIGMLLLHLRRGGVGGIGVEGGGEAVSVIVT